MKRSTNRRDGTRVGYTFGLSGRYVSDFWTAVRKCCYNYPHRIQTLAGHYYSDFWDLLAGIHTQEWQSIWTTKCLVSSSSPLRFFSFFSPLLFILILADQTAVVEGSLNFSMFYFRCTHSTKCTITFYFVNFHVLNLVAVYYMFLNIRRCLSLFLSATAVALNAVRYVHQFFHILLVYDYVLVLNDEVRVIIGTFSHWSKDADMGTFFKP